MRIFFLFPLKQPLFHVPVFFLLLLSCGETRTIPELNGSGESSQKVKSYCTFVKQLLLGELF